MKYTATLLSATALALVGFSAPSLGQQPRTDAALTQSASVQSLFAAINRGDWAMAENLASQLDANKPEGDLMLAFVYAARYVAADNCEQGLPFAQAVVDIAPNFLPAYDLVATCLDKQGKGAQAAKLYRQAAQRLDDGDPERDQLLARANRLSPDLSPAFTVEGAVQPSTNINRGTDARSIGFGRISETARRKSGAVIGAFAKLEKPVYATSRLFASVSLRVGASYLTHTKQFMPEAKIAGTLRWLATEKTIVTTQASYAYILRDDAFYASRPSVSFDLSHQLTSSITLGASAGITYNRMASAHLDGYNGFVSSSVTKSVSPTDKVTLTASFDWSERRFESQNHKGFGADVEWEHLWQNGFITSLGGGGNWQRYEGLAPLTSERQINKSIYGRIGLSHNKLLFGTVRPELTYTANKQWSNDVFSKHVAHDVGFRAKAAF